MVSFASVRDFLNSGTVSYGPLLEPLLSKGCNIPACNGGVFTNTLCMLWSEDNGLSGDFL